MDTARPSRWNGRLTARELPLEDESIARLSPGERQELGRHWLTRAASERRVAESFGVIHRTLREAGADGTLVQLAARAVDDEYRHAEIARIVASRFAGRELPAPALLPVSFPEHRGAGPELKRTLYLVGQCVLNGTSASVVLESALAATTGKLARAALGALLSDEIDHARLGWAHLSTLDARRLADLAPWLLTLARANIRMWRGSPRDYPGDAKLVCQGALSQELLENALQTALRDLIIPGLARFGLPTLALSQWLELGAPTDPRP